ncbi:hypothetical protein JW905_07730 [bacterium]|nr:hypothetical protein [candidate division CSSED10-310 bacterium]
MNKAIVAQSDRTGILVSSAVALLSCITWHGWWGYYRLPLDGCWDWLYPLMCAPFLVAIPLLHYAGDRRSPAWIAPLDSVVSLVVAVFPAVVRHLPGSDPQACLLVLLFSQWLIRTVELLAVLHSNAVPFGRTFYRLSMVAVFASIVSLQQHHSAMSQVEGDEPYYLLVAHSIVQDGDLDITDDFTDGEYRRFMAVGLKEFYLEHRGEKIAGRPPGLPLLLAAGYLAAGRRGALAILALIAAALFVQWLKLSRDLNLPGTPSLWAAHALLFSYPVLNYSLRIFPELPAALILVVLGRLMVRESGWRSGLITAVLLGFTATLKLRFLLAVGPMAAVVMTRMCCGRKVVRTGVVLILVMGGGLVTFYLMSSSGGAHLTYRFNELLKLRSENFSPLKGSLGLLLDQQFGLLPRNPLYILALAAMLRLPWLPLRRRWSMFLALIPYLAAVAGMEFWTGGWSPPPRFLVAVLPMCAVYAVARLGQTGMHPSLLWAGILWAGLGTLASLLFPQGLSYFVAPPHGGSRALMALGGIIGQPATRLWPSVFRPSVWTWVAGLLLIIVLVAPRRWSHRHGARFCDPRSLFGGAVICMGVLCAGLASWLVPAMVVYPGDLRGGDRAGKLDGEGFLLRDDLEFPLTAVPGRGFLLLSAWPEPDEDSERAFHVQVNQEDLSIRDAEVRFDRWYLWPVRLHYRNRIAVRLTGEDGEAAFLRLERIEFLPHSALLSRITGATTALFGYCWTAGQREERLIRAFLMDPGSRKSAEAVCGHFLEEGRIAHALTWCDLMPDEVLNSLPEDMRRLLLDGASMRHREDLVSRLLGTISRMSDEWSASLRCRHVLRTTGWNDDATAMSCAEQCLDAETVVAALDLLPEEERAGRRAVLLPRMPEKEVRLLEYLRGESMMRETVGGPAVYCIGGAEFTATAGEVVNGGRVLTTNGSIHGAISLRGNDVICLTLRGTAARGIWPEALILMDGRKVAALDVRGDHWREYEFRVSVAPGVHHLELMFTNDYYYPKDDEDRNLYMSRCCVVDTTGCGH